MKRHYDKTLNVDVYKLAASDLHAFDPKMPPELIDRPGWYWRERRDYRYKPPMACDGPFPTLAAALRAVRVDRYSREVLFAGKQYVRNLPRTLPDGTVIVHNHVRPARTIGDRGFRVWTQPANPATLDACTCAWGRGREHYRVNFDRVHALLDRVE